MQRNLGHVIEKIVTTSNKKKQSKREGEQSIALKKWMEDITGAKTDSKALNFRG